MQSVPCGVDKMGLVRSPLRQSHYRGANQALQNTNSVEVRQVLRQRRLTVRPRIDYIKETGWAQAAQRDRTSFVKSDSKDGIILLKTARVKPPRAKCIQDIQGHTICIAIHFRCDAHASRRFSSVRLLFKSFTARERKT